MRFAGSASWRVSVTDNTPGTDLALHVRDAAGLVPAADPTHPPPLLDRPPDARGLLDDAGRIRASEQWAGRRRPPTNACGASARRT